MNDQVIIRTPIPTPEQMADSLGVSRERLEELRTILREQGSIGPARRSSRRKVSQRRSVATTSSAPATVATAKSRNGKSAR